MLRARLSRRTFARGAALALATSYFSRSISPAMAATSPSWQLLAPDGSGPVARWDHTLAADDSGRHLIVFGGRDANLVSLGDTWLFNLRIRTWTQVDGDGPSPRFGHVVAVDQRARALYLFGGQHGDTFFNDTWRFDFESGRWRQLDDGLGQAPSPRYGLGGVLDASGRFLISHGFTFEGRFDDTWAFDTRERTWTDLSPVTGIRPLKRCLHEQVWDPSARRMLLYGGCSSGFGPCPQGDVWSYDPSARTWTELTPAGGPAPRSNPSLVWDRSGRRALLFGGLADFGYAGDFWTGEFDDGAFAWSELAVAGDAPGPRASHDAVITGGRLYLFGGTSNAGTFGDLWRMRLPRE